MYCNVFSSVPGFYLLDPSRTLPPNVSGEMTDSVAGERIDESSVSHSIRKKGKL